MLQITEKLLQEMTDLLVREANPRKIILFGSHAHGTARADSDLDFLIVEEGPFNAQRSRRAEMTRMRSILGDYFIPMDFLVFTPQEIEEWKDVRNHVVSHALREGRTLYESH
ncbi:MAG TPA: nucleotidyltransferase domain-containing protein [Desulfuromonadales bacterium]|nr:nucleotidyltransferase domain-containing protein [Desulfuromonadales bacterium]